MYIYIYMYIYMYIYICIYIYIVLISGVYKTNIRHLRHPRWSAEPLGMTPKSCHSAFAPIIFSVDITSIVGATNKVNSLLGDKSW